MADKMMDVQVFLFDNFETLDAFGPVEVLGRAAGMALRCVSLRGGMVTSRQQVRIQTQAVTTSQRGESADARDLVLLLPGGQGTRAGVSDAGLLAALRLMAQQARYVLTVCTGSALLAKTGLLDGRAATSNKKAWEWVTSTAPAVRWQRRARWCVDGKFYTSSGVSAGMDMALAFVAGVQGSEAARAIARDIEYRWHEDAGDDPFAV